MYLWRPKCSLRVTKMLVKPPRLIETDAFPFEFVSQLAERESWRKEIHRPIYHVHKWWAKRLGSVFRAILLGSVIGPDDDLVVRFNEKHAFANMVLYDPFMGSGTTVGEGHKLGLTVLGRDINPVAVDAARVAFGPMDRQRLERAYETLSQTVGEAIRSLYRSTDSLERPCDVLYYFWVMQVVCPSCDRAFDLFPTWVVARNAYPTRKTETRILCRNCGAIFTGRHGSKEASCHSCGYVFNPYVGTANGANATCSFCRRTFDIIASVKLRGCRPDFRLYGKLVLTEDQTKEYARVTEADLVEYRKCSSQLGKELALRHITLPTLHLSDGYNTRQALSYGFLSWRDFFNDRQLLALSWLQGAIIQVSDAATRNALLVFFSGLLEFNNLFASYKGEGTGAVRHMFSHHILKPERTPIEANVWGTPRSSGSFHNLFRSRLLRAIEYRMAPREVGLAADTPTAISALPFSGQVEDRWPTNGEFTDRAIYLSCGDAADHTLPDESVDLIVTDPPFFDNVHYSELADFFYAWQQLSRGADGSRTTRTSFDVQDSDADNFTAKLGRVFGDCKRVLKSSGLFVFTYHHSRQEGWHAIGRAILDAGFLVVNSHPVKAEMSVATPKVSAKEPIQLDIIIVCRKRETAISELAPSRERALQIAQDKLRRLREVRLQLSRNDCMIVLWGQLLVTLRCVEDLKLLNDTVEKNVQTLYNGEHSMGYKPNNDTEPSPGYVQGSLFPNSTGTRAA